MSSSPCDFRTNSLKVEVSCHDGLELFGQKDFPIRDGKVPASRGWPTGGCARIAEVQPKAAGSIRF